MAQRSLQNTFYGVVSFLQIPTNHTEKQIKRIKSPREEQSKVESERGSQDRPKILDEDRASVTNNNNMQIDADAAAQKGKFSKLLTCNSPSPISHAPSQEGTLPISVASLSSFPTFPFFNYL